MGWRENKMAESKSGERQIISAKISTKSFDGWKAFCDSNGVSVTAMIEVAGIVLGAESNPPSVVERIQMVETAREIDIERRARK